MKTPPIMTPPLNSPSVLISFETMKFRRGHFRAKPDPLLARQLTCLINGMHNTRMGSELGAFSQIAKENRFNRSSRSSPVVGRGSNE